MDYKPITIEEKAKAYDEALEKARCYYEGANGNEDMITMTTTMFPVLKEDKESEDARMMNWIIEASKFYANYIEDKKGLSEALAWIAKKGEKELVTCPICGWKSEKQGEQKCFDISSSLVLKHRKENSMTKQESKWIKFYPSLDLPKERVSIAYDTHDDRGYRFAYGHFQFYNGTCGCFWKDGNEQPKVVKAEDIKYWMPIPSFDVQEEPASEDLNTAAKEYANNITEKIGYRLQLRRAVCFGAKWQKEQMMAKAVGVEVKVDAGGYPYIPQIELYDYDKDIPLAEVDDKYKVILIKED